MIIERHYDDEVLIGLLEESEKDSHLPGCDTCGESLESYRDLAAALHDESVWDDRELSEKPAPQTLSMLREFAAKTAAEDAAAGPIVSELVAASAEKRTALLERNPHWRTAGVVRKLISRIDDVNYTDPKFATELAEIAVQTAESLDAAVYPLDTVTRLRATAWRERAYALYYIGSYLESLSALDRTDELLRQCTISEYDSAQAALTRAQIYGEIERLDEAIVLVDSAREVFRRFGNIQREAAADVSKANLLAHAQRFAEALPIHLRIAADSRIDETPRAIAVLNAAFAYRELSNLTQAKSLFTQAIAQFERLGLVSLRSRARWHLAQVFLAEQRFEHALSVATEVRCEFEELGMAQDVALVSVDAAEALLMLDRPAEVVDLCKAAMEYFSRAGVAYTQGALTALAYLKEAAQSRTLTKVALGDLRAFFELLPKRPELLFVNPA